MTTEFTVDHKDDVADDNGIVPLIGWVIASVETKPGNYRVRDLGGPMPRALKLEPRKGYLAADGHMYKDDSLTAPFRLVANDPAFNLRELTYRFDFDLTTAVGVPVSIPFCRGPAPSSDTTLYLARLMNDIDQPVIEVRTKGYAGDLLDATESGIALVTGTTQTALARAQELQWLPGTAYVAGQPTTSPYGALIVRESAGTSRASYDSTEQSRWLSKPYSADYWCDIVNSENRSGGESVSLATMLTHDTPGSPGYVEVCPAFTNQVGPFFHGTLGPTSGPGVFPWDTAIGTERWSSVNTDVDINILYINAYELEYSMTVTPGAADNSAGIKTKLITGTDTGDWEASFYLDMSGTNTEKLAFYVAWESDPDARFFVMPTWPPGNSQGHGRIAMTLPPSGESDDRLMFMVSNSYHSDITVRVILKDIVVAPAVSNLLRDSALVVHGSQAARTATLNVPNGDYDLFAWTDRGITPAVATASGGDGLDLREVFGTCRIYKVAAWVAGRYVAGMVDDDPQYVPVRHADSAAMLQLRTVTAPSANIAPLSPDQPWSLMRSSAFVNRSRIEVRPGDRWLYEPSLFKRRNELACYNSMPYDADVDLSYPFRIFGSISHGVNTGQIEESNFGIIWQWRYTDMVGDLYGMSPEFALSIGPDHTIALQTTNSLVQNPPDGTPPYVTRWTGTYTEGQWHHFFARTQFNPDGGGMLGVWWDGEEVYSYQATPVGHHKTFGPQCHWGYYGVQSNDVIVIERANLEFGLDDLSSRIARPLPI